jgi:hypothetical protein
MRKFGLAAGTLFVLCLRLHSATAVPPDGFAPGWKKSEALRVFAGPGLFDHIDGGAELYLEFGFLKLEVQRYEKEDDELVLEIYEMDSPEAGLGLYLMKCGRETPVPGIAARNSSEPAQFTILKGRAFIHVNNPSGRDNLLPAMTTLANLALAAIPDEKPRDIISILPAGGLVAGSTVLFRGPVGLSSLFTLGEGDILEQKARIFGAAGTYEGVPEGRHILLVVPYPDEAAARAAFLNLSSRLDPYLRILERADGGIVFEDYENKFGRAVRTGSKVEIKVRLSGKPALAG